MLNDSKQRSVVMVWVGVALCVGVVWLALPNSADKGPSDAQAKTAGGVVDEPAAVAEGSAPEGPKAPKAPKAPSPAGAKPVSPPNTQKALSAAPSQPQRSPRCCVCNRDAPDECACIPRGSSIVFMGDDISLHQYLDLVYSLKYGSEGEWARRSSNWPTVPLSYKHAGNSGLQLTHMTETNAELQPEEWCNCHPTSSEKEKRLSWEHYISNRYYHDAHCGVNVTVFSFPGNAPIEGHLSGAYGERPAGVPEIRKLLVKMRTYKQFKWVYKWRDAITKVVAHLRPSLLVLNQGHFASSASIDYMDLRRAAAAAAQCVVWRTTTKPRSATKAPPDTSARAAFAMDAIFDAGRITEELKDPKTAYVDAWRFMPRVYHQLNYRMLSVLFPQSAAGLAPRSMAGAACPRGYTFV